MQVVKTNDRGMPTHVVLTDDEAWARIKFEEYLDWGYDCEHAMRRVRRLAAVTMRNNIDREFWKYLV
jgi:hypothetical protein